MINPKARPCEEEFIRSVPGLPNCTRQQQPWVLAATILGSTIAYIDESVVNVALPAIETDLSTGLAAMQWVVNAYTLCVAALLLTGGTAGDRFGRRAVFVTGVALFATASIACGFATGIVWLIAARAVQGVGAALLIPSSLAIIGAAFDKRERGQAIGIWSRCAAIATGLGPLLGGWLVDRWSWREIFLINPVLAVPTLWIIWRHVPESRNSPSQGDLDWWGYASCMNYGLVEVHFGCPENGQEQLQEVGVGQARMGGRHDRSKADGRDGTSGSQGSPPSCRCGSCLERDQRGVELCPQSLTRYYPPRSSRLHVASPVVPEADHESSS